MNKFYNIDDIIKNSSKILITSHINPDGDTLGTMCALHSAIYENFKKNADMFITSKVPFAYRDLPFIEKAKSNYDHCYYNHRPFELEMKQIHEHFKEDKIIGKNIILLLDTIHNMNKYHNDYLIHDDEKNDEETKNKKIEYQKKVNNLEDCLKNKIAVISSKSNISFKCCNVFS